MARKRRPPAAGFKAKVALTVVRGVKATSKLALEFGVHPTQIAKWKKQLHGGFGGDLSGERVEPSR